MEEEEKIKEKIGSILKPLSKEIRHDETTYISFGDDDKKEIRTYSMPKKDFIHSYYITHLNETKIPILGIIYDNIFGQNGGSACTGEIRVDLNNESLITSKINFKYSITNVVTNSLFKKFIEELEYRINNENCKGFTSLIIGITFNDYKNKLSGHRNALFITKKIQSGKTHIDMYLYEPHGSSYTEYDVEPYDGMKKFLNILKEKYEKITRHTVTIKDELNISCPIGLQIVSEDENGFCIMFCYVWLYVVLNLIKSGIDPELAIYNAETEIINYASSNPEKLMTIILNFSMKIMEIYVNYLSQGPRTKLKTDELKDFFIRGFGNTQRGLEKNILPSTSSTQHKTIRRSRPVETIEKTAIGKVKGKDGSVCLSDDDCQSYYCSNNRCVGLQDDDFGMEEREDKMEDNEEYEEY